MRTQYTFQFCGFTIWPAPEIMLGKCDSVHSGAAMAFVAVGIVGLTIVSTLGLMGYFQVPNGPSAMNLMGLNILILDEP